MDERLGNQTRKAQGTTRLDRSGGAIAWCGGTCCCAHHRWSVELVGCSLQSEEVDGSLVVTKHVGVHLAEVVEVHRWWTPNESGETCGC